MRVLQVFLIVALSALASVSKGQGAPSAKNSSLDQKLEHIRTNGAREHPDTAPTEFTEHEVNGYLASPEVKLPVGVRSVTLQAAPGIVTGNSRVDFDQIRAGSHSSNPLLSVFSGVHDVVVVAHAKGRGGQGFVDIDSVSLDGVEIPQFVLELFVEKYLQPKYPQIGLRSRFTLPNRIDTAVVGTHKLVIAQK